MLRAVTFGHCYFETPVARIAPDAEIHFALLLTITSGAPDGVPRDEVVARLWPGATLDDARHCLRQATYRLRQLAVPVQLNAGRLVLDWSATAIDLQVLLHDVPTRQELVRLGGLEFLPSYLPGLGPAYGHWVEELRSRVSARLRQALADEVASARARGRFHEMGQIARLLLSLDPLHELGTMVLAESLALEGSKVEALRLLEQYEAEVGAVNTNLQLPVRVLRRRVAEVFDDSVMLRRLEVPFVGREGEFGALRRIWRDVRGGSSAAVILTGEAGIGKTRLAGELMRFAALDGATLATYTTSAGDTFTPLSTLVAVGQQLLSLPGALGCAEEHLAYVRRLGTPDTVSVWQVAGMAADVLYAQLVQALAELVCAIAEEAPLLLFVDDAERLHPTTWRVIVDVWDRVGRHGVLFVLAARRLPPWFGSLGARSCERLTQHVAVAPLARAESLDFLRSWSARGGGMFDDECAESLAVASRGNPFYLTEFAMHVGHGGDPEQTPVNIRELIGAQHRVLGRPAQRVLLQVAVLEARATTWRVTQALEMPASEFMAALDELEAAGLVSVQGPEVRVQHRMVGEVAVSQSTKGVRDFAHRRAASLLEGEADTSASVELLGDCVTHWERAGETRRAYDAAMKLGGRLVGLGMGEEAEKAYVRAEDLAAEPHDRLLALEGRMVASALSARWLSVHTLAGTRATLLPPPSRRRKFDDLELLAAEAELFSLSGTPSITRISELVVAPQLSRATRLRASILLAILADNFFDRRLFAQSVSLASGLIADTDTDDGALLQVIFHSTLGDRRKARRLLAQLVDPLRELPDYSMRLLGLRRAAEASLRIGNPDSALEYAEEALALSRRLKLPVQEADSLALSVRILLAGSLLDSAEKQATTLRDLPVSREGTTLMQSVLADAQLAWSTQDATLMRSVRERMSAVSTPPVPRAEQQYHAIMQATSLLDEEITADRQTIARLYELHRRGKAFGNQDFSSSILVESLRRMGQRSTANRVRDSYLLRGRRETYPIPTTLMGLST